MKWCVEYNEFCLVIKFKHKIPSVCMQKIFLLALWSQKIKYFMQPWDNLLSLSFCQAIYAFNCMHDDDDDDDDFIDPSLV